MMLSFILFYVNLILITHSQSCPEGSACPFLDNTQVFCDENVYCPPNTQFIQQHQCDPGYYSYSTSPFLPASCVPCPAGYFCPPNNTKPISCPPGHFCPPNTISKHQYPCPAGTYSPFPNLSTSDQCLTCPPGFYCPEGSSSAALTCPKGYYCPPGTTSSFQHPCPLGTYNSLRGISHINECEYCPEGSFCLEAAETYQTCPPGTFSRNRSYTETNFSFSANTVPNSGDQCIICPAGYFCPPGSSRPLECGRGFYSDDQAATCSVCLSGYECHSRATSRAAMLLANCPDSAVDCRSPGIDFQSSKGRNPCPLGYQCYINGVLSQTMPLLPAALGYKIDEPGIVTASRPGFYIDIPAAIAESGECEGHHLCQEASISGKGARGADAYVLCPPGYQRVALQGRKYEDDDYFSSAVIQCSLCRPGYFCPMGNYNGVLYDAPEICPPGSYCPQGSITPIPCPKGYFSSTSGLETIDSCIKCIPGSYCNGEGLGAPSGLCNAGYLCYEGAFEAAPLDGLSGDLCSPGGYCLTGSVSKWPCPSGMFANSSGATDSSFCNNCPPGRYCPGTTESAGRECEAGYYCTGGAVHGQQHITPAGSVSDVGAIAPSACAAGTYQPLSAQKTCLNCMSKKYCPNGGLGSGLDCSAGNYCPTGSINPSPCPIGTYSAAGRFISKVEECTPCDSGRFCNMQGRNSIAGDCEEGYYCTQGATSATPSVAVAALSKNEPFQFGPCPQGHYCEEGTVAPVKCLPGTYNDQSRSSSSFACNACPGGFACTGLGLTTPTSLCSPGYFCSPGAISNRDVLCPLGSSCPSGSAFPTTCPEGSYAWQNASSVCPFCPAGFACAAGAVEFSSSPCPPGRYCPLGTRNSNVQQCPLGSYAPNPYGKKLSDCLSCPPGSYCSQLGLVLHEGNCAEGFYCDERSNASTSQVCPPGYYCPTGSTQPTKCTAGSYCSASQLALPLGLCEAGYYCPAGAVSSRENICPPGYYCPEGTALPNPCLAGYYQPNTHAVDSAACILCTAGNYCNVPALSAVAGPCKEGYFCPAGSIFEQSLAQICPSGTFCPTGAASPQVCQAGYFQPLQGQSTCRYCNEGYSCTTTGQFACPQGHYCDGGTVSSLEDACPSGFFSSVLMRKQLNDCFECPSGKVCSTTGVAIPSDVCPAGYICPTGTTDANGIACVIGSYCPSGSARALPCSPGTYCGVPALSAPESNCSEGYFCKTLATLGNPPSVSGQTSHSCPNVRSYGKCKDGEYCNAGAVWPSDCPPGSYALVGAGAYEATCMSCPESYVCPGYALLDYTSITCEAGNYCPLSSRSIAQEACPVGHFCPDSSSRPIECPTGSYSPVKGLVECFVCPERSYCDIMGLSQYKLCPSGHYCPEGSVSPTPCPAGSFRSAMAGAHLSDCVPCPPGATCTTAGMTLVTAGSSSEGYYCRLGCSSLTPVADGVCATGTCFPGDICPLGLFCPAGSAAPISCPLGKSTTSSGTSEPQSCVDCPAGYYCGSDGEQRICTGGFVCAGGASVPSPIDGVTGYVCPVGHYCPAGTITPISCPMGTYSDIVGNSLCTPCPGGFLCLSTGLTNGDAQQCPAGNYCEEGALTATLCPAGSYATGPGVRLQASDCSLCPRGRYCPNSGETSIGLICPAGYYCNEGSSSAGVPCPEGHYCLAGTKSPTACPIGTFAPNAGGTDATACQQCTGGNVCSARGLIAPNELCSAGFYCVRGAYSRTPISNREGTGDVCPLGHYCPEGSSNAIPCPAGTYAPNYGSPLCTPSPPAYTSSSGARTIFLCPSGVYCPGVNADDYSNIVVSLKCSAGLYSNNVGLSSNAHCADCQASKACDENALISGCNAGFLCIKGAMSVDPLAWNPTYTIGTAVSLAGPCPSGHYCDKSALYPSPCPSGTSRLLPGGSTIADCAPCAAGYFCPLKSVHSFPCTVGSYCPPSSTQPTACPQGLYNPLTSMSSISDCLPCPSGYLCRDLPKLLDIGISSQKSIEVFKPNTRKWLGVSNYEQYLCPAFYYCPGESAVAVPCPEGTFADTTAVRGEECAPCPERYYCSMAPTFIPQPCPESYYCPIGSMFPISCPEGHYCTTSLASPIPCPAGYYCPAGSATFIVCPAGHYCPSVSGAPRACPAGTHGPPTKNTQSNESSACTQCEPGYQQSKIGQPVCEICPSGYICIGGTNSDKPEDIVVDKGRKCDPGYYCEAGSFEPVACPSGSYSAESGGKSIQSCLPCDKNTFNPLIGQSKCKLCGSTSTSNAGATVCTCIGLNRYFQAGDGSCLCKSGYESFTIEMPDLGYTRNSNTIKKDDEQDGIGDCQPIILPSCVSDIQGVKGELSISMLGEQQVSSLDQYGVCTDARLVDCTDTCGSLGGKYMEKVGSCICNEVSMDPFYLCDASCQSKRYNCEYSNLLQSFIFHPVSASTGIIFPSVKHKMLVDSQELTGELTCKGTMTSLCPVVFLQVDSIGVRAIFGTHDAFLQKAQDSEAPFDFDGISEQPAMYGSTQCLQLNSILIWDIHEGYIPIVDKNSILNSNDSFDQSAFRALQKLAQGSLLSPKYALPKFFSHSFAVPGTYVFVGKSMSDETIGMSAKNKITLKVLPEGISCGGEDGQREKNRRLQASSVESESVGLMPLPSTEESFALAQISLEHSLNDIDVSLKESAMSIASFILSIVIINFFLIYWTYQCVKYLMHRSLLQRAIILDDAATFGDKNFLYNDESKANQLSLSIAKDTAAYSGETALTLHQEEGNLALPNNYPYITFSDAQLNEVLSIVIAEADNQTPISVIMEKALRYLTRLHRAAVQFGKEERTKVKVSTKGVIEECENLKSEILSALQRNLDYASESIESLKESEKLLEDIKTQAKQLNLLDDTGKAEEKTEGNNSSIIAKLISADDFFRKKTLLEEFQEINKGSNSSLNVSESILEKLSEGEEMEKYIDHLSIQFNTGERRNIKLEIVPILLSEGKLSDRENWDLLKQEMEDPLIDERLKGKVDDQLKSIQMHYLQDGILLEGQLLKDDKEKEAELRRNLAAALLSKLKNGKDEDREKIIRQHQQVIEKALKEGEIRKARMKEEMLARMKKRHLVRKGDAVTLVDDEKVEEDIKRNIAHWADILAAQVLEQQERLREAAAKERLIDNALSTLPDKNFQFLQEYTKKEKEKMAKEVQTSFDEKRRFLIAGQEKEDLAKLEKERDNKLSNIDATSQSLQARLERQENVLKSQLEKEQLQVNDAREKINEKVNGLTVEKTKQLNNEKLKLMDKLLQIENNANADISEAKRRAFLDLNEVISGLKSKYDYNVDLLQAIVKMDPSLEDVIASRADALLQEYERDVAAASNRSKEEVDKRVRQLLEDHGKQRDAAYKESQMLIQERLEKVRDEMMELQKLLGAVEKRQNGLNAEKDKFGKVEIASVRKEVLALRRANSLNDVDEEDPEKNGLLSNQIIQANTAEKREKELALIDTNLNDDLANIDEALSLRNEMIDQELLRYEKLHRNDGEVLLPDFVSLGRQNSASELPESMLWNNDYTKILIAANAPTVERSKLGQLTLEEDLSQDEEKRRKLIREWEKALNNFDNVIGGKQLSLEGKINQRNELRKKKKQEEESKNLKTIAIEHQASTYDVMTRLSALRGHANLHTMSNSHIKKNEAFLDHQRILELSRQHDDKIKDLEKTQDERRRLFMKELEAEEGSIEREKALLKKKIVDDFKKQKAKLQVQLNVEKELDPNQKGTLLSDYEKALDLLDTEMEVSIENQLENFNNRLENRKERNKQRKLLLLQQQKLEKENLMASKEREIQMNLDTIRHEFLERERSQKKEGETATQNLKRLKEEWENEHKTQTQIKSKQLEEEKLANMKMTFSKIQLEVMDLELAADEQFALDLRKPENGLNETQRQRLEQSKSQLVLIAHKIRGDDQSNISQLEKDFSKDFAAMSANEKKILTTMASYLTHYGDHQSDGKGMNPLEILHAGVEPYSELLENETVRQNRALEEELVALREAQINQILEIIKGFEKKWSDGEEKKGKNQEKTGGMDIETEKAMELIRTKVIGELRKLKEEKRRREEETENKIQILNEELKEKERLAKEKIDSEIKKRRLESETMKEKWQAEKAEELANAKRQLFDEKYSRFEEKMISVNEKLPETRKRIMDEQEENTKKLMAAIQAEFAVQSEVVNKKLREKQKRREQLVMERQLNALVISQQKQLRQKKLIAEEKENLKMKEKVHSEVNTVRLLAKKWTNRIRKKLEERSGGAGNEVAEEEEANVDDIYFDRLVKTEDILKKKIRHINQSMNSLLQQCYDTKQRLFAILDNRYSQKSTSIESVLKIPRKQMEDFDRSITEIQSMLSMAKAVGSKSTVEV